MCNLNLKLCEIVSPDKVNWFAYNFDLKIDIFANEKVPEIFKRYCANEIPFFLLSYIEI